MLHYPPRETQTHKAAKYVAVTAEELLAAVNGKPWLENLIRAQQFFGLVYYQTTHDVVALQPAEKELQEGRPMQDLPQWLLSRLVSTGVFGEQEINQVAANRYIGTGGIAAHVEDPVSFGPNLATLSLLQPVQLTLSLASEVKNSREAPGDGVDHGNWVKILLEPRSLLVLQGESRYAYRHGIRRSRLVHLRDGSTLKRGTEYCRISLTFRHLLDTRRQLPSVSPQEDGDVAAERADQVTARDSRGLVGLPSEKGASRDTVPADLESVQCKAPFFTPPTKSCLSTEIRDAPTPPNPPNKTFTICPWSFVHPGWSLCRATRRPSVHRRDHSSPPCFSPPKSSRRDLGLYWTHWSWTTGCFPSTGLTGAGCPSRCGSLPSASLRTAMVRGESNPKKGSIFTTNLIYI